jgi:microcystin-dependent protein
MGTPYMGEIKIVSWNYPPRGWAECNGQLMPINQNQALFSLFGTNFGGDGRVNFGLPNLQGRAPMHVGAGHNTGEVGGEINHTLTLAEMPAHTHTLTVNGGAGNTGVPAGNFLADTVDKVYATPQSPIALVPGTVGNTGGSQAHTNMQPYLVLNFVVALQGVFPSPN